uniref:Uncharacterized protein n=1 Tax=Sphaerodactylus townsendi TaxID=933632 RepID=A0ACB8FDU4_9SAUR
MSETPSTTYSVTQPHTSETEQSLSPRPLNVTDPVVAKRICFYKSGDPQFNGVKMVVNSRSFKSFDALLDNLSKRVPLPFGVRTITTPRGIHGVTNLEDLEDGKSYICSQQKKIKPINLDKASKKPLPWQISRPVSARRKAIQLAREGEDGVFQRGGNIHIGTPKKLLVFKNGDARIHRTIVLGKKNTQNFEAFLDHISELMQYPVEKLYTTDGRKVPSLQALILCSGAVVAASREPFRPGSYDPHRQHPYIEINVFKEEAGMNALSLSLSFALKYGHQHVSSSDSSSRSQIFSTSSYKGYSNDNDSAFSYVPDNDRGITENHSHAGEDLFVEHTEDDIEKSVHLNQDGSMTVEMRVRFKIKEEETIKWSTTVSRAGFSTERNAETGSAVVTEEQSSELNMLTCENITEDSNNTEEDAANQQISEEVNSKGVGTCNYDIWQNPAMNIESNADKVKPHFYRPPTPGPRRLRKKKAVVESITTVSDTAVQKKMVGQFSYSEETDTGETKSEYCLVTHSSNKTSNVNNLQCSKTSGNQVPKQSLEDEVEEKMLNKVRYQTTIERSVDLPGEGDLLQNILGKSAVEEGLHNYITSDCDPDISHVEFSPRNYRASEEVLANQSCAADTEQKHSGYSQSKREEMICSQEHRLSHDCIHPSPCESNQTVCQCARITTTVTESSITANNTSVECITTHLSDGSQVLSSSSKKKKKKIKSSSDIREEGGYTQYRLRDSTMEGTAENGANVSVTPVTKDVISHPTSQITVHKRGQEFLVHNTNGAYKNLDTKEDLYSQGSMSHQQNESNFKQDLNNQLPKIRLKSDKKINLLSSQKDLLLDKHYSKSEIKHISEGTHDSTNIKMQTPLNETGSGCKEDKEKSKSFKPSVKHKKVNKNKRMECSPRTQGKVSDESCTMDAFIHANDTAEHSLESYVQSWLQNIIPGTVTPAKNFACLNHLNKKGIVEESSKNADASKIDDTEPDIHNNAIQSRCDIVHTNDKKKTPLESNSRHLSDDQRCRSEVATQADPKAIDVILGTNMQTDCVSSLLLHQLKSAVLNFEKSHTGCVEKPCCLTDIAPSVLGSSSGILLAWLLVQTFKEHFSSMNNDDISQATCNFSEIVALQQYLKQVMAKEEVKDLKNYISNLQECTGNHLVFSGMQTEVQEPTHCQENVFSVDTVNISDFEAQGKLSKTLNSNNRLDSKKVTNSNKLTEELERKNHENYSTLTENPNLYDLDNHYALHDSDCCDAYQSNNCRLTSNEKVPKENDDTSSQESLDKNIDRSFNNEESGLTEEPRSTTYSLTSNDKDHTFDIETSELEDKDSNSIEEQECTESPQKEENSSEHLSLTAENAAKSGSNENSVQQCVEESGTHEEPSVQLSAPSPQPFCHESKQLPANASVGEPISRVKLIVKELECGSYSNSPSTFKRSFRSSTASDLSDYPPDSERSDYTYMPSSDLTYGSTEEAVYEKEYNRGFVKRTIERLYGKTEMPLKPISKLSSPSMSQMIAGDTEEYFQSTEEASSLCKASNEKMSLLTYEIPGEIHTNSNQWEEENVTWPAPQFSLNGEEECYNEESSVQCTNQYSQSEAHTAEDEGVLIDKGKWFLKENHLIRRSPPENSGMYGNIETTSTETVVDNHSDDIPYSHFGNLDRQPPLKEMSSETEDIAKPFDDGCNYFNMPHNSESEPLPDELSIKSKHSQYGNTLPVEATRKECTTPTRPCAEVNTNSPSFRTIEFRLPDNKVHPSEQPSQDEVHLTQPTGNTHSSRTRHEDQDSLDKLHAICGQHCPILMAIVKPTNEEVRGCAYRKASDFENQLGLYFLMNSLNLKWQGKDVNKFGNKLVDLKKSCINTITNNIFIRFYAESTLEFMNENKFGLLMSKTLKESKTLKKSYARDNMDVDAEELNNLENHATKNIFREITMDHNPNVLVCQSARNNGNHVAEMQPASSSADVAEAAKWKVTVFTSDQPSAGTSSQVYIALYGDQSNSGAIFLYGEKKNVFERGNKDTFIIQTDDVGDLYKVRIGHNNSGENPAWHCKEFLLQNLMTDEQFDFPVHRWLAQDQDNGEICRELPVLQQGQPLLPVAMYEVQVVTGDLWNAGTEADVYISVYGEEGDTGSRQMHRSKKPRKFLKGQADIFSLEAVHLGKLHKIIIGHNGLGSGNGWFLEKIVVIDPITNSDYNFLCHRWLDQGEDDGNIFRELHVITNSTFAGRQELEIKRKEMWEAEKWKYQKGNTLQLYNKVTRSFIRLSPDGTVDALGDKKDKYGFFDLTLKKGNICTFKCHPMPHLALALVHGSVTGMDNGDISCELQVHLQANRCAILESVRNPGQIVTFNLQGTIADDTMSYAGLTKEFVVHVKGVFHNSAIILLTTSPCQSLCLRPDGSCSGAGNQTDDSYWRVHKISSGVCMFESVKNPQMYLRIKDDQCDGRGTGDTNCHFKVEKNLESGAISLESVRNRGIYVGLLPDGQTRPVVHTGESNVLFYPQVLKFGRGKPMGTSATAAEQKAEIRESKQPPPGIQNLVSNGESDSSLSTWKLSFTHPLHPKKKDTKSSGETCWETGIPGQVEIKRTGSIYKIRIGQDGTKKHSEWMIAKVTLQHIKSRKILNFPANKRLSWSQGKGDILCELPVEENGKCLYPILSYQVYVYTGHVEQAETDSAVYLCICGERGDSGLRLLRESDKPMKFQRGKVIMFEIQAVSLGNLRKVVLRCEANHKSQHWYCEKVIIRETGKDLAYLFSCER